LMAPWTLTKDGKVLMSIPRIGFIRSVLMNHLYHHRGQLSVYLRILEVPVPSIYGPSADENPFG
jgi:DinB family